MSRPIVSRRVPFERAVTCQKCGRPIVWAETESGKRVPLDVQPTWRGALELVTDPGEPARVVSAGEHRRLAMRKAPAGLDGPPGLYRNHLIDCKPPREGDRQMFE